MTYMDMPLPEPAHTQVETYSGIALNKVVETPLFTADQLRAYGEAVRAEERDWWREIAEQLIACHDEPTCPAVTLARERLHPLPVRGNDMLDYDALWQKACIYAEHLADNCWPVRNDRWRECFYRARDRQYRLYIFPPR